MEYLWMYILAGTVVLSLGGFFITFSRDLFLTKSLKLSKKGMILNFSLLVISVLAIGMITYLFVILKQQIDFLG